MNAYLQDGPYAGYTYPWSAGRWRLVIEGIAAIHTYELRAGMDEQGRVVLVHQKSEPRPARREGDQL